ncbi:MAG: NUDIX hydrolase [Bacteroides sp.]|nr:NUDIX hydrolase [Bacteroides sp.]
MDETFDLGAGSYYSVHDRYPVSVDCILFSLHGGELSVLLAPRKFEPHRGVPSLMGGFVKHDETLDEAAARVLWELTGLDDVYMEQVGAFGALDRDPGERVISVAYFALIKSDGVIDARVGKYDAEWVSVGRLPELKFDHPLMIERALDALHRKVAREPVAFNLLPELFTLTQAQMLYERILGRSVDKRNFRRQLLDNKCIELTDKIDKLNSRRGAAMYRFNRESYKETLKFKI